MYVTNCAIGTAEMTPEMARDDMSLQFHTKSGKNSVQQLRGIAGLCNSGEFDATTNDKPLHERRIIGDATDQAVLRFSESLGPVSELKEMWKKDFELAFNSKNKFMIRLVSLVEEKGRNILPAAEASSFSMDDQ